MKLVILATADGPTAAVNPSLVTALVPHPEDPALTIIHFNASTIELVVKGTTEQVAAALNSGVNFAFVELVEGTRPEPGEFGA